MSSKTVTDILIANDLYKVRVKNRRPQFYQSLRQSIPNGLVSVDGKEFKIVIGEEVYTFNLEMSVDVHSFMHSAFSVSDTETTAEFIKVLEDHCAQWGKPLALVTDHGSANLSDRAQVYLQENDIEILPAGPANPKGNGTVESAFSGMEEVIGTICLDASSPYSLAKGIFEKIVSVYVTMRNRLTRRESRGCPEAMMETPVKTQQRQDLRGRYRQNIQVEMDAARYKEYCREHYNYQQMKDRERQKREIEQDKTTVDVMVDTLRAAISCPLTQVKDTAINQARRMALDLQSQYRYVAPLKKKVLDVLDGIKEVTLIQRKTIVGFGDQFLT